MKLRYSLLTLAVAMGLTFGLSSCTEEDNPVVPGVGAPTDIMINTLDANQISAKWTRASDDLGADTLIIRNSAGTRVGSAVAFAGTSTAIVSGLSSGTLYTVSVTSADNESSGIEWATALRSAKIRLYETSGSGPNQPSGLIIGPSSHGSVASAISINDKDSLLIDLVLATDDRASTAPAYLALQGGNVEGSQIPNADTTFIGDIVNYVAGGLANDYYTSGFASQISGTKLWYDQLGDPNSKNKSAILLLRLQDGHYARVEVVSQANGDLYTFEGSVKAVDVIVSYQPLVGKAYASRPVNRKNSGIEIKKSGPGAVGVVKN